MSGSHLKKNASRTKSRTAVVTIEPEPEPIEGPEGGLGEDPLSADDLLEQTFYRPLPERRLRAADKPKPTHYKVVSISLYQEDIERLEKLVAELKRRGHTKANKSQLIRYALDTVDLDGMPRGY
ncbi:MAG: hypothetical protein U1E65_36545 [Myxococcota bacterium]